MKLQPPVFAALGFLALVTPAYGGWTNCGTHFPGRCRLECGFLERALFMCDRYRQCCIKDPIPSILKMGKTAPTWPAVPTLGAIFTKAERHFEKHPTCDL
ncbi:PREDICTED: beta-defensin 132 [Condylura cristata]|uniref:beta-defensin 132 n=1 Tax=Condylura cristata TaxID=143302 RepID=UPI000642880C|nr:PREDICTED: beta-defensin 132 [Condylura cristata]